MTDNVRYTPSGQAMVDASRVANEQWPKKPKGTYGTYTDTSPGPPLKLGVTMPTKQGTKRIRVRRCTRTVQLQGGVVLQCQLDQHSEDDHYASVMVHQADGNTKWVKITWRDIGLVPPMVLVKGEGKSRERIKPAAGGGAAAQPNTNT